MQIAVASGKGGTGKTTVAVALALVAPGQVQLLDCDVEEPNAGIFLFKTQNGAQTQTSEEEITIPIPVVDEEKCTGCGSCKTACKFNAIILLKKQVMIFPDLCHSCGACVMACPENALSELPQPIGQVRESVNGALRFIQGELKIGFAMSPPLIRAVKNRAKTEMGTAKPTLPETLTLIDCPPGTSCPMVTSVRGSDFVVLVTEPTPFGLHDLKLAVATIRKMELSFGVVVNRSDVGDNRVTDWCGKEGISVLASIPDDRKVAVAYSNGGNLLSAGEKYRVLMEKLYEDIHSRVRDGKKS